MKRRRGRPKSIVLEKKKETTFGKELYKWDYNRKKLNEDLFVKREVLFLGIYKGNVGKIKQDLAMHPYDKLENRWRFIPFLNVFDKLRVLCEMMEESGAAIRNDLLFFNEKIHAFLSEENPDQDKIVMVVEEGNKVITTAGTKRDIIFNQISNTEIMLFGEPSESKMGGRAGTLIKDFEENYTSVLEIAIDIVECIKSLHDYYKIYKELIKLDDEMIKELTDMIQKEVNILQAKLDTIAEAEKMKEEQAKYEPREVFSEEDIKKIAGDRFKNMECVYCSKPIDKIGKKFCDHNHQMNFRRGKILIDERAIPHILYKSNPHIT